LLVWISLRWFGIDFTDFRMGREEKREKRQEKRTKKGKAEAEKKEVEKRKEEEEEEEKEKSEANGTGVKKAWSERLTWRRKKTTQTDEGAEEA
jgi:hypothetical protein